jgi:hypothetical protein
MGLHVNRHLALEIPVEVERLAAPRDPRAELVSQFIPAGARVLDLSHGRKTLERYLPNGCSYRAVERGKRKGAVVCDIANGDFPTQAAAQSDIIVMLGALERIADLESLFTHLRFAKQDMIVSYCATDLSGGRDREARGFVNHLSFCDLTLLFDRFGFRIECTAPLDGREMLMRLTPSARVAPLALCSVAVVSGDANDFGSRLGRSVINALLPGEAEVHHLSFGALHQARERYDLVVLGTGNGLFQPLIGEDVLDLIGRSKASIGIFGTQYRELIPRPAIERLIERLDIWFARTEDDVLMYGRGRRNVQHLGDWLIDQFPLAQATEDEPLEITGEMAGDLALDHAIALIQRHRQVYSNQPQPLLCALTAAEMVAYADDPTGPMTGVASGQFRSMLIDIFGRSYPAKKFFLVDRDAVARYKARVHRNVATVRERIEAALRNVAVAAG